MIGRSSRAGRLVLSYGQPSYCKLFGRSRSHFAVHHGGRARRRVDLSGEEKLVETPHTGPCPDSVVLAELTRAFAGQLPRRAVADEVERAARELRGQVPNGCLAELLHRLAAHRLGRLSATR